MTSHQSELRKRMLVNSALVFAAFVSSVLFGAATAQMNIPGDFAVDQSGAATYSIPIQVPPGVNGLEPKLSLAYSSLGGNGLLGVGWSLGGLSTITRCGQTSGQDGGAWVGGVSYNATDRFCLDGQRLVPVPNLAAGATVAGQYGADGTWYSTERESFSRVQSFGVVNSGALIEPNYFVVTTKAGLTMEYGRTADSRVPATNGTASLGVTRLWQLNRVTDRLGNYMTILYSAADLVNGQSIPYQIDYTGNSLSSPALAPKNRIHFQYEGRPDVSPTFTGGAIVKNTLRLVQVVTTTNGGNQTVLYYNAKYAPLAPERNDSYISDLTVIEGSLNAKRLVPTSFSYPTLSTTFSESPAGKGSALGYWSGFQAQNTQPFHFTGDFNGDGQADFMYWTDPTVGWTLMSRDSAGNFVSTNWGKGTGPGYWTGYSLASNSQTFQFVGDFNGDGRSDIMYWIGPPSGWRVLLSTGSGWTETNWGNGTGLGYWPGYATAPKSSQQFQFTGDFNGDGRTDFMYFAETGWTVLLSTGSGWNQQVWGKGSSTGYWTGFNASPSSSQTFHFVADLNGDRKSDFLYWDGTLGWRALLSTGSGWLDQLWGKGDVGPGAHTGHMAVPRAYQSFHHLGDFNGDGNSDFLYWDTVSAGWRVLMSTGAGWAKSTLFGKGDGLGYFSAWATATSQPFHFVGDYNGDGKTDFAYWEDTVGWKALLSTGTGWLPRLLGGRTKGPGYWPSYTAVSTVPFQFADDFNGDGSADLMYWSGPTLGWMVLSAPGNRLVSSISTWGSSQSPPSIQLTYGTPAQMVASGGYTRSQPAVSPMIDIVPTWPVVTDALMSNGGGSSNRTMYRYDSAATDSISGRGFGGFNFVESQDVATGLTRRSYFLRDFPFAGLLSKTQLGTSSILPLRSRTTYQYGCKDFAGGCLVGPGKRYLTYPNDVYDESWEYIQTSASTFNVLAMPPTRTTQALDDFGNALQIKVETFNPGGSPSGYSKTTENVFVNDTTKWWLGRLLRSTVTSAAP